MKKSKTVKAASPVSRKEKRPENKNWYLIALVGIVMLTFTLYANSLRNDILTFDDNEYFLNYPEILDLTWESVGKYFTNYYVIMYQPLPVLTFAINYHFTGTDTFPLHLVNLLFHLANIVLVFYFIKGLVSNNTIALLVALLFAVHPMNTEAVTWISARSSSMYTFFYLWALIYYLKYVKNSGMKYLVIAGSFFLLSLFSKAQAVTFPVLMLLLDFYFNRSLKSSKVWIEKIPFFLLSITFGLVTLGDIDTMRNITSGMLINYSFLDIIFLVCYSFLFYLFKLLIPVNLCAVHVYPPKMGMWLPWEYYVAGILFAGIIYLLFKFRRNKTVILCAGIFLITIAINIQIIPSRLFIVTDRYAYFPYIGLYLLPLMLVNERISRPKFSSRYLPGLLTILVVAVLSFSYITNRRNLVWRSDIPFLTDIIEKNPEVPYLYRAYGNRALAYKQKAMFPEALKDLDNAIRIKQGDSQSHYNRALVFAAMNDHSRALTDLNKAIELEDKQPVLYNHRGQVRLMLQDTSGAEKDLKKCLELDSTYSDAYNSLATIDYSRNNLEKCEHLLSMALKYDPAFTIGMKNRGLVYLKLNRKADACIDFQNASNLGNYEAKQYFTQYCK